MDSVALVPAESMRHIFVPLWNRITELVIVTSEEYGLCQSDHSGLLLNPLLSMSEDIIRCLKDLSMVAKQTVSLRYRDDAVVKKEVDFCSQNMMMAGESLVLGCHILCSKNKSDVHIKNPMPQQMDVCGCLSDLYQCMILLLLAIDDAEVRKITNFGLTTTKALTSLVAANTLQRVNDYFRSLAVPAANFYNLAVLRCNDISDKGLQYELRCAIATLRQSLPMLSTSLQMAIKYPDQPKALKGRDYCVQQVYKAILDINKKVALKSTRKSPFLGVECGLFHENLIHIKDYVATEKRNSLNLYGLSYTLQTFIQHALELALSVSKIDTETKCAHNNLVSSCRKMMRSFRELENVYGNHEISKELRANQINEACINLVAMSEASMIPVIDAAVVLVIHTFVPMEEPLVDLIEACIHPDTKLLDDTESMKQSKVQYELKMNGLTEKYSNYINGIKQTIVFSASCCKNSAVYKKYDKVLRCFDDLSKAVTMAITEYQQSKDQNDLLRNDQIMDIKERWRMAFYDVIQLVVLSLDLKFLLDYVVKNTIMGIDACTEGVVNLDSKKIVQNLHKVTGLAVFVEKIGFAVVSNSTAPVYRNGVLSHVKKLKNTTVHSTAFGNELLGDIGQIEQQDLFTTTLKNLLETMQVVSKAILCEDNHPELTSITRRDVRSETVHSNHPNVLKGDLLPFSSDDESMENKLWASWDSLSTSHVLANDSCAMVNDEAKENDMAMMKSTNPIVSHLLSCLLEACQNGSTDGSVENAKEQFSEACELNLEIAKNTLMESSLEKTSKQRRQIVKKSSEAVESLENLILKDVERIMESRLQKRPENIEHSDDFISLNILATQWSQASSKITNECMALLPLYVVPIRRYCMYFLDSLTEEQKSVVTKSLIPYAGYKSILLDNLTTFTNAHEWDDISFTDINVHEKNVGELVRLINAISELVPSEISSDKQPDVLQRCKAIHTDWRKSCEIKEKTLLLIEKISSGRDEQADKLLLHLHCLSWSSKIHALHVNALETAKLLLLEFKVNVQQVTLIPMILNANAPKTKEIAQYDLMLSTLLECHGTCYFGRDSLTSTWSDNLKLTKEVIEELLAYLSSIRSSVPLIFHHGHSMFHLMHLHHLFYVMLSYLMLAKNQEKKYLSEYGDRPSLSARLKSLKEQRERHDDSLNDLLQTVPKLDI